jgi:hypothetical protein
MQWSKLKARIRDLICSELQPRIDFHVTSYRKSYDGADKVWITVDGVKVFSCKHYTRDRELYAARRRGLTSDEAKTHLRQFAIHGPNDFGNAMRAYLELPVREARASEEPIIRLRIVECQQRAHKCAF